MVAHLTAQQIADLQAALAADEARGRNALRA